MREVAEEEDSVREDKAGSGAQPQKKIDLSVFRLHRALKLA